MRTMDYRRRRFLFAPVILIALAVFTAVTMLLWNNLMTSLFSLPVISFWQAMGLLILARLLFGGHRMHNRWHDNSWRRKWFKEISKLSPEERKAYFKRWQSQRHAWHSHHFADENSQEGEENTDQK